MDENPNKNQDSLLFPPWKRARIDASPAQIGEDAAENNQQEISTQQNPQAGQESVIESRTSYPLHEDNNSPAFSVTNALSQPNVHSIVEPPAFAVDTRQSTSDTAILPVREGGTQESSIFSLTDARINEISRELSMEEFIQFASLSSLLLPVSVSSTTRGNSRYATDDIGTDDEDVPRTTLSTAAICDTSRLSTCDFGFFDVPSSLALGLTDDSLEDLQMMIFSWAKDHKVDDTIRFLKFMMQDEMHSKLVKRLIKSEDTSGLTLLMIAVKSNQFSLCSTLLQAGADVNQHNRTYALLLAAQKGSSKMAQFLVDHGANQDSRNMALIPASHFGHLGVVHVLLECGAQQNYTNRKGTTPLMRAAQEGRDDVVEYLLKRGVDVCTANNEGMTSLMLASQRGHANIAKRLIDAGSDVNQQTRQGSTALILASKRGHVEAVEALLTAGADIFLKDDRGKAAAETAHRRGHVDLFLKISVGNQLRLMRQGLRRQRCYELVRLSALYLLRRAGIRQSYLASHWKQYSSLMHRTLHLPRPLLRNIATFLPDCTMWERRLQYLRYEAPYQPNRVVHQGIQMIDEILSSAIDNVLSTVSIPSSVKPSASRLALLRDSVSYQRLLVNDAQAPLDSDLIVKMRQMADIQGALKSYPVGLAIHFGIEVAQDVVSLLRSLLDWESRRIKKQIHEMERLDSVGKQ
ncbi:unnamed protein product [Albugo candida]|uniref:Uncharacterized protein n=1 Tax=Albugo candida TaxID=65357 RepID=A0A024G401_9STRA|nr:unnamed protein product [Albugo candida]|eukprot:CCI41371.1 unnamed protein product [Albugo candida]